MKMVRSRQDGSSVSSPRLVVLAGPLEGRIIEIGTEPLTVGRQSSNTVQLRHEAVSRHHGDLRREDGRVVLRDLDSLCGTFVDGVPIAEHRLRHGELIKIGDTLFVFMQEPEDRARAPEMPLFDSGVTAKSTVEMPLSDFYPASPEGLTGDSHAEAPAVRRLTALLEFSSAVHNIGAVEALGHRVAELILDLVPAERSAVLLCEGDETELVASSGTPTGSLAVSQTLVRKALDRQIAVLSNDVAEDRTLQLADSVHQARIRSLLCVPLPSADRPLGLLYADTRERPARFGEEHLQLLAAAGNIAASALRNARRLEWLEAHNRRLRNSQLEHDMVGESPAMKRVYDLISRVAPSDLTVLIVGESGTGKELAAKALHRNSPRADKPFIAVNCATLSESLLESELFGHEKGAFTGAIGRKLGHLELADTGTVFLDEVGEIPPPLQAKLLRALESHEIQRVGGTRPIAVDVRIVAATNRDLEAAIRDGEFRRDLYHRLDVFKLELPPLRERRQDIPLLTHHFLARSSRRMQRPSIGLSARARSCLAAYDWPGNVRELRNAVERAVVLTMDDLIQPEDLPDAVLDSSVGSHGSASSFHEIVCETKRRVILDAVRDADGNIQEAANRLGLNRTYLHRLISNLNLRAEFET